MEAVQQDTEEQTAIFGALGDPTRLRLIRLLCQQHAPNALCVNALAHTLGVTQSAVSQHLRVLRAIDLVRGERRGYHIHYFINRETLERCRNLVSTALTIEESDGEESKEHCPIRRE